MEQIDLGRAIKAPFEDAEWFKKTLLGMLWMFLLFTSPAVTGAHLEYLRRVSQGREDLPEWDDFGTKWVEGFLLSVAAFIYFLPLLVLGIVFALPVIVAGASDSDALGGLASGGACLFFLIAAIYGIVVWVFFGAATVNYAMRGEFGAFFQFSDILARIREGSGYFAAWVWALVVAFAASAVTSVISGIPLLGLLVAYGVIYVELMIIGHLYGQWAARSYRVPQTGVPVGIPGYVPPAGMYAPPAPPAYPPPAPPAPPAPPQAAAEPQIPLVPPAPPGGPPEDPGPSTP